LCDWLDKVKSVTYRRVEKRQLGDRPTSGVMHLTSFNDDASDCYSITVSHAGRSVDVALQRRCYMFLFAAGVAPVLPGPARLMAHFVPCCTAASILHASQCLCDPQIIAGDNTAFIQQLVGFAPLAYGFTLTASCQEAGSRRNFKISIYLCL